MFHHDESIEQVANRLHLHPAIRNALAKRFDHATKCQAEAWEAALGGHSIFLKSATGSGKTLAFLIPTLQKVFSAKELLKVMPEPFQKNHYGPLQLPCAVIAVPTGELAAQITALLADMLAPSPALSVAETPSTTDVCPWYAWYDEERKRISKKPSKQRSKLTKQAASTNSLPTLANIVIGTPAALQTWAKQIEVQSKQLKPEIIFSCVKMLVVDEADALFDQSPDDASRISMERSIGDLCRIMGGGMTVQGFVASATLGSGVESLRGMLTNNPKEIHVAAASRAPEEVEMNARESVEETFLATEVKYRNHDERDMDKLLMVYYLVLEGVVQSPMVVFVNEVKTCMKVTLFLRMFGYRVHAVFDDIGMAGRANIVEGFTAGRSDILVFCDKGISSHGSDGSDTDDENEPTTKKTTQTSEILSARGIDFESRVKTVINYDMPFDKSTYIHRIGRSGRGGDVGVSVTMVDPNDVPDWFDTEIAQENIADLDEDNLLKPQCAQYRYRVVDKAKTLSYSVVKSSIQAEIKGALSLSDLIAHKNFPDTPQGKRQLRDFIKSYADQGGDLTMRLPKGVIPMRPGVKAKLVKPKMKHLAKSAILHTDSRLSGQGNIKGRFTANFKKRGTFAAQQRKKGASQGTSKAGKIRSRKKSASKQR